MLPDDVQLLQQDVSAGIGGRLVHRVIAIVGGDRVLPARRAVVQVSHGQQAALFVAEPDDGLANGSPVEDVPTLLRDGRQGPRQVGLPEDVSRPQRLPGPIPREDRPAGGKLAQQRVAGDCRRQVVCNREPVVGQGDGRSEHVGQGQRPVLGMDVQPGVEQTRHRYAQDAFHGDAIAIPLQGRGVGRGTGSVGHTQ